MTRRPFSTEHPPATSRDLTWLWAILALALVLRTVGLDSSLWYDEVDTLVNYVRLPFGELVQTYGSLNNHMFFSLQAKVSVALFGETPWALRLPAMLLGVASIWALWKLAREVMGTTHAHLAALLMAVSYHHVWFSQNARGYTGLMVFGLLATLYLVRGTRAPTWGTWLAYGLCFAASMYTHLSAAFLFAAHAAAYLVWFATAALRGAGLPKGAFVMPLVGAGAGVVLVLALYAPLMADMMETFGAVQSGPVSETEAQSIAQWKSPLWMLGEIAAAFADFGPAVALALPLVLVVIGIGLLALGRVSPVLGLVLPLHVLVTVALLITLGFRVWPRYFIVDLGFICLALIAGAWVIGGWLAPLATRLWGRALGRPQAGTLLGALGIAASLVLLPKNYLYPKQDYVSARDYVEDRAGADANIITVGLGVMPFELYYAPDWNVAESFEAFESFYDPARETWIVYSFPEVVENRHADIFERLGPDFNEVAYFHGTLGGGGIVVMTRDE